MALMMRPEPFSREVDRLFDAFFGQGDRETRRWVPPVDLVEAEDHFVLKADLPGLSEEDISIEIQDNTLTVSGERRAEHEERHRGWYRVERSFGRFSRSLTLPEGVNPEAVAASFDRGVLSITIPKPEQRQPRRVTISASGQRVEHPAVESTGTEQPAGAPPSGGGGGPTGPGIAPDAPPVEGQGGQEREMPPVAGGEEPSGSVDNRSSQSSSDQATPAQAGQSAGEPAGGTQHPTEHGGPSTDTGEELPGDQRPDIMRDASEQGETEWGSPAETSATPAGSGEVESKFTGQGGLDRESVIEGAEGGGEMDELSTPEEHPDPGETPPSQGPEH